MSIPAHIDRVLRVNGIRLDESKAAQLGLFVDLLLEWNRRINLVSRRDSANIWESHILHSLSILFVLEIPRGLSVLDLGSGGGLPGIPLAIVRGDLKVTLLDSIQKKVRVLEDIVQRLGMSGVAVAGARAEDIGKEGRFRGSFDAVIARAVAPLVDLVKWSRPLLRPAGREMGRRADAQVERGQRFSFPSLLALKGGDVQKEIRDVRLRGGRESITEINLVYPGSENVGLVDKKLVVVEYPRI